MRINSAFSFPCFPAFLVLTEMDEDKKQAGNITPDSSLKQKQDPAGFDAETSAYEQLRLQNIKRNNAILSSLDLPELPEQEPRPEPRQRKPKRQPGGGILAEMAR